jgi:serine/threonine protein kinase
MAMQTANSSRSVLADRYEVLGKLGEGGMGLVYRAHDLRLDTDVVIKVPRATLLEEDADFAARFDREIRALVKLSHPHIVKVLDVGKHDGLPFAVMQYLPGGSLRDSQARGADGRPAPLPADIVSRWLAGWLSDIAAALDFMHRQGYIHRDIKPDNILFDASGHAYLSDFGIAKILADQRPRHERTVATGTGMVLGTAQYMAPEVMLGQPFDGRADQFALAVTVYELVSGRLPFDGPTAAAIIVQQTSRAPTPLESVAPGTQAALAAAVHQALVVAPEKRFADCGTFARAVIGSSAHNAPVVLSAVSTASVAASDTAVRAGTDPAGQMAVSVTPATGGGSSGTAVPSPVAGAPLVFPVPEAGFRPASLRTRLGWRLWVIIGVLMSGGLVGGVLLAWWQSGPPVLSAGSRPSAPPTSRGTGHSAAMQGTVPPRIEPKPRIDSKPPPPPPPKLFKDLTVTGPAKLLPGDRAVAKIRLQRLAGYEGPIELRVSGQPGIDSPTIECGRLTSRQYEIEVPLNMTAAPRPGAYQWKFIAQAPDTEAAQTFSLIVPEPKLEVTADDTLTIPGKQQRALTVKVARSDGCRGAVTVRWQSPLPSGLRVQVDSLTIRRDQEVAKWEIAAEPTFSDETHRLQLVAQAEDGATATCAAKIVVPAFVGAIDSFDGHAGGVGSVAFAATGDWFVTGGQDRAVCRWSLGKHQPEWKASLHTDPISCVAVSPDTAYVISGGSEGNLQLWRALDGKPQSGLIKAHGLAIFDFTFLRGGIVCSQARDTSQRSWRLESGEEVGKETACKPLADYRFASPKKNYDAWGVGETTLQLVAKNVKKNQRPKVSSVPTGARVASLVFSADERRLLVCCENGKLHLFEVDTAKLVTTFEGHQGPVMTAAFVPDGRTVVSGGKDGKLIVWRLPK